MKLFFKRNKNFLIICKIVLKIIFRKIRLKWIYDRKLLIIKTFIFSIIVLLTIFSLRNKTEIIDNSTHTKEIIYVDTTNTLKNFLYQLRYIESKNNHLSRRNKEVVIKTSHGLDTVKIYSQYIGYYQIGTSARKNICDVCPSLKNYSINEFWNSKFIQHKSAICWFIYLKKTLKDEINENKNTFHGSFYITESGLLAMAHIVGPATVKKWINNEYNLSYTYSIEDGFGKKGIDYLQQLGGYNLNLERFINQDGEIINKKINNYIRKIMRNENNYQIKYNYKIIDTLIIK